MSSLLTWASYPADTQNIGSSYGANTPLNRLRQLIDALQIYAADPASRWMVASVDEASANPYICLKRKTGAPGRILFQYLSTLVNLNNAALLSADATSPIVVNNAYASMFPFGTSDVPANIFSPGAIFVDDTDSTKFSTLIDNQQAVSYYIYDCEDGLYIINALTNSINGHIIIGEFLENSAGDAKALACCQPAGPQGQIGSLPTPGFNAGALNAVAAGGHTISSVFVYASGISANQSRDVAAAKMSYHPMFFSGYTWRFQGTFVWKLRQIAYSARSLAPGETKFRNGVGGPELDSICADPVTSVSANGGPWLTNFKV